MKSARENMAVGSTGGRRWVGNGNAFQFPCAFLWMLLALVSLSGLSCSDLSDTEQSQTPASAEQQALPDQESWDSTILITRDGRLVARVWAGYLASFKKEQKTLLKDSVVADFYNEQGEHTSRLTAREGWIYHQKQDFVARGNVVVVSDSGIVLQTEELRWDHQKQKIISDVPVVFTTPTDTLLGDRFISDPDLTHYEIHNARGVSRRPVAREKKPR